LFVSLQDDDAVARREDRCTAIVLIACIPPALRASRADPLIALRAE
jgi:hypothetical protein